MTQLKDNNRKNNSLKIKDLKNNNNIFQISKHFDIIPKEFIF